MPPENELSRARRLTPPIAALAAFEAVARLASFTDAAAELSLTQSAVSRQITALEGLLGVALFEGNRRKQVIPTAAGLLYAERVRAILANLASATSEAVALGGRGRPLRLGIPPTFGSRWLMPRLPEFFASQPGVAIEFATRLPHHARQSLDNLDASIDFLPAAQAEPGWQKLMELDLVLVATPKVRRRYTETGPDPAARFQLLVHRAERQSLSDMLESPDVRVLRDAAILPFESYAMLFQATESELGIGVAPRVFIERELAERRLVAVSDLVTRSKNVGYMMIAPGRESCPTLETFRQWLLQALTQSPPRRIAPTPATHRTGTAVAAPPWR